MIRLNQAAAEFVLDLLRQFAHGKRYQSQLLAELEVASRQTTIMTSVSNAINQIEGGAIGNNVLQLERGFVLEVLRPVALIVFQEIQENDSAIEALSRQYDRALALDFYKRLLAQTEDDLGYYKSYCSEEEISSIQHSIANMRTTLIQAEPKRSNEIHDSLGASLATLEVPEDHPYRELLDQIEEIAEEQRDDLILPVRHNPSIKDYL